MNNVWEYPEGATPLSQDELFELIPKHVATQQELNAVEQLNVARGLMWLDKKKLSIDLVLTEAFICQLHRRLFGDVWRWAGSFRKSDKNIGVDWLRIPVELRKLLADVKFQMQRQILPVKEIALRFHHSLVYMHLFPNGNGRHARILVDFFLECVGSAPLSWGGHVLSSYAKQTENRSSYIRALRVADQGDFSLLFRFVDLEEHVY